MTRKRYIKLLMSQGMSRNYTDAFAYACQVTGTSYAADYERRRLWLQLAKAARQISATLLNFTKEIKTAMAAIENLRDRLAAHPAQPITPENLEGGKMYIVTRQEHDRLHGYSAKVSYIDDIDGQGGGGHD